MRIISGQWRGQPIKVPKGVRPTTDRVREAVFSILGDADNTRILDLYAGSGSLGIEALSRGAQEASFVDISRRALSIISTNLSEKGVENFSVIKRDVLQFLQQSEGVFDWIFCDPPYHEVNYYQLLQALSASTVLGTDTLLILESDRYHPFEIPVDLNLADQRKFGDTLIHFLRRPDHLIDEVQRA